MLQKNSWIFGREKFLVSFLQMCAQLLNNSSFFCNSHLFFSSPLPIQHSHLDSLCPVCAFLLLLLCAWCHDHFNSYNLYMFFFCTRRELLNRIFSCWIELLSVERLKNMNGSKKMFNLLMILFFFCIFKKRERERNEIEMETMDGKNRLRRMRIWKNMTSNFNRFREVSVMTIFETNRQGYFDWEKILLLPF